MVNNIFFNHSFVNERVAGVRRLEEAYVFVEVNLWNNADGDELVDGQVASWALYIYFLVLYRRLETRGLGARQRAERVFGPREILDAHGVLVDHELWHCKE